MSRPCTHSTPTVNHRQPEGIGPDGTESAERRLSVSRVSIDVGAFRSDLCVRGALATSELTAVAVWPKGLVTYRPDDPSQMEAGHPSRREGHSAISSFLARPSQGFRRDRSPTTMSAKDPSWTDATETDVQEPGRPGLGPGQTGDRVLWPRRPYGQASRRMPWLRIPTGRLHLRDGNRAGRWVH